MSGRGKGKAVMKGDNKSWELNQQEYGELVRKIFKKIGRELNTKFIFRENPFASAVPDCPWTYEIEEFTHIDIVRWVSGGYFRKVIKVSYERDLDEEKLELDIRDAVQELIDRK
jgi:hypothetical protein